VAISMAEEQNLEPEHTESDPETDGEAAPAREPLPVVTKGMTPGQRLAAKKAQKAGKKRDLKEEIKQREQEAQEKAQAESNAVLPVEPALPEEVQQVARDFSDFAHEKQGWILGGLAAFVVISALVIIASRFASSGNAEAAEALEAALETSTALIDAENKTGKTEDGKPVFASRADRNKKSIEAFASVAKKFGDDKVGVWAKLGEAGAQVQAGAYDKARALYEGVYNAHKSDAVIGARALEGLAVSLEALDKRDEAMKRYEELKTLGSNDYTKNTAEYHVARLQLAKGDREAAKKLLKGLYDRLSERAEGEPESKFLKGEVEIRLAEIDSSLVDKGTTSNAGESFSQEQLQQLLQQLKMKGTLPGGAGAE